MLIDIDTITIANAREGLVATTGDRVDLTIGQEEAPHHVVGNLRMAVAKIDQATTGVSSHHAKRGAMEEDPRGYDTITVGGLLEGDAHGTIPQELDGGDGVLVQGPQQLREDGG